tara:strand:- start:5957 stop:6343 length:387 start_codon:yes stop_codon:yes gene_type:complete
MIPASYPTSYVTANGDVAMVVELITSTSGLTAWVDYLPVKFTVLDSDPVNRFSNDGTLLVDELLSTSGLVAGVDYLKVYEDLSATIPWSTDTAGYIPVYKQNDYTIDNLATETGYNLLQESGYLLQLD